MYLSKQRAIIQLRDYYLSVTDKSLTRTYKSEEVAWLPDKTNFSSFLIQTLNE